MALPVLLRAVVDELEIMGGEAEWRAFINRHTGEIYGGTQDHIDAAEDADGDEGLLDWEIEVIQRLREVLASPDWLELPPRDSHDDHEIMERFCLEDSDGLLQEELLSTIAGRGAFRRFNDAIHRHSIQDRWYAFRHKQLKEAAKAWLEAHGISYET